GPTVQRYPSEMLHRPQHDSGNGDDAILSAVMGDVPPSSWIPPVFSQRFSAVDGSLFLPGFQTIFA
ncbi:MAG: hypothetical protein KDA91_26335, partial [Planctomycetaceae bacterium]|nr:hypothetical protein [Planctomycetaceae bacterium]